MKLCWEQDGRETGVNLTPSGRHHSGKQFAEACSLGPLPEEVIWAGCPGSVTKQRMLKGESASSVCTSLFRMWVLPTAVAPRLLKNQKTSSTRFAESKTNVQTSVVFLYTCKWTTQKWNSESKSIKKNEILQNKFNKRSTKCILWNYKTLLTET